jgi:hypothetical protein
MADQLNPPFMDICVSLAFPKKRQSLRLCLLENISRGCAARDFCSSHCYDLAYFGNRIPADLAAHVGVGRKFSVYFWNKSGEPNEKRNLVSWAQIV